MFDRIYRNDRIRREACTISAVADIEHALSWIHM